MVKFWAISKNTFLQTIRQPVFGIIVACTYLVLVVSVPLSGWTMGTDYQRTDQLFMETMGLSTIMIAGLFLAAFSASAAVNREIEDRTALTVIAKPVGRSLFVAGKFAGLTLAVSLGFYLCAMAFLMTARHGIISAAWMHHDWPTIVLGVTALVLSLLIALAGNYMFGWTFTSAAVLVNAVLMTTAGLVIAFVGPEWTVVPFAEGINPQLPGALVLMLMVVLLGVAVAVAASTRLGQVMTLLTCLGFLLVGSFFPGIVTRYADENVLIAALGLVLPRLTWFFPFDALMQGQTIPASYLLLAGLYAAAYGGMLLCVAMALFQTRQLSAESSSSVPGAVGLLAWTGRLSAVVAGVAAIVLLSLPAWQTLGGVLLAVGLLLAAAGWWIAWTRFAHARWWAYWLILGVLGLGVAAVTLTVVAPATAGQIGLTSSDASTAGGLLAAAMVVLMLLPRTRSYFRQPGIRRTRAALA